MFTFNVSGSSSQGRSSPKPTFVPSTYIAKQLALEEESRRQKGLSTQHDHSPYSSFQADVSEEWPTRDEVLAPGYNAGPLGYDLPKQSLRSNFSSQHNLNGSSSAHRPQDVRFDSGAGVGSSTDSNQFTASRSRSLSNAGLRLNTSVDSSADQSSSSIGAGSNGISRNNRPEFNLDDIQKKSVSVRFSTVAPELVTPRPQTPSIFNQNSASPFFTNAHSSPNSGMSNLQSALKGNGKVDVLSHRGATGTPSLNSSLGPALGSVSGATQPSQQYTSPKLMNSELNSASMRNNTISGNNAPGSSFFLNLDNGSVRQNPVHQNSLGKGPRNEDEEDKDKERYMPAILLRTASGLKGSKIEPFVDGTNGKTEWDSDSSFQQSGPGREGNTRLAPHLMGDDAPPSDTLRDIAQKEKYYTTTLPQLANTNSRFNSGDLLNGEGSGNSQSIPKVDDGFDSIITYGFPPEATSYMLNQFRSFGTIARYESGSYGQVASESFNWLKIQFRGTWAARNATSRHLQSVGKFIVGVHACPSFADALHGDSSMDLSADGARRSGPTTQFTDTEAREIEEGVIMLLKMRAQGVGAGSKLGGQVEATKARHASLSESWNRGSAGLNNSQSSMGFSPTRTLNDSTTSNAARPLGVDQEDEEMVFILGRSLTSGGLTRPVRGRGFEQEKGEFLRSRSNDQLRHGQDQDSNRNAVDGGILADSQTVEAGSVGFRPLFGHSESRGLSVLGQSQQQQQQRQQQQQQQQQPYQIQSSQLFEHRQYSDFSGSQQSNMSLRRPNLGNSVASDTTLFASSGGMLLDASSGHNDHYRSSEPTSFHAQKKQRLSSGLSLMSSSSTNSNTGNVVPLSQFGRGRDRSSILVDDPSLVDQWGAPLSKNSQTTASTTASSSSMASSAKGTAGGNNPNTAGQHTTAAPESMISSVINMAKKRLFWG